MFRILKPLILILFCLISANTFTSVFAGSDEGDVAGISSGNAGMEMSNVSDLANANSNTNSDVSINAALQNDKIVVTVTDGNNGNKMNKTQIWGDCGDGWFLIKGFDNWKDKSSFTWDTKTIDNDNENYFSSNPVHSDMLKLYVLYKHDNSSNHPPIEFYKTFYLGTPKQDVSLLSQDEKSNMIPARYDFPVVVDQNKRVDLYLQTPVNNSEKYKVRITGDHYINELTTEVKGNEKVYSWVPNESGNFRITVDDGSGQTVLERKVYVNSIDGKYVQLSNLSVSNENNTVFVRLKVAEPSPGPTNYNGSVSKNLRFTVSDPEIWTKTIKNYGEVIGYNSEKGSYEIKEGDIMDGGKVFQLGSGYYYFRAQTKQPHSIEAEDVIGTQFRKTGVSTDFSIDMACTGGKPNKDGSYNIGSNFTFTATSKIPQKDCQYAFLLYDARGKRLIQGYSQNALFNWNPADPGKYVVYARIRMSDTKGTLPNSYEKELAFPITIKYTGGDIKIDNVTVKNANPNETKVMSHELNMVVINPKNSGAKERLMYKVYSYNKGVYTMLNSYTYSNIIPFYPIDKGQYKLIALIKDSISGSEEDRLEFSVNVE